MPSRIVATSCEGSTTWHSGGSTSLSVISANQFTSQCLRRCSSVMTARICCGTRFSMRRLIFAALRITSQESGQQPPWHWLEPYLISHSTRYRIKLVTCVFQLNLNALAHRDNRLHDYPHIMIDRRLLVERYSGTTYFVPLPSSDELCEDGQRHVIRRPHAMLYLLWSSGNKLNSTGPVKLVLARP